MPETSLLEELNAPARQRGGKSCSFGLWLAARTPEEAAAVRRELGNDRRSDREMASILTAHGFSISSSSIGKHRRGECVSCRTS